MSAQGSSEGSQAADGRGRRGPIRSEDDMVKALGISLVAPPTAAQAQPETDIPTESEHVVVPDPHADAVDLSDLRGTRAPTTGAERMKTMGEEENGDDDLNALAEIVPALKSQGTKDYNSHTMTIDATGVERKVAAEVVENETFGAADSPIEVSADVEKKMPTEKRQGARPPIVTNDSMVPQTSENAANSPPSAQRAKPPTGAKKDYPGDVGSNSSPVLRYEDDDQNLGGFDGNSDDALDDDNVEAKDEPSEVARKPPEDGINPLSSNVSLSTATQTHEVRMPMYLPTFKPATGCTNASDFIVRCFVARLRSGITVVKHGRSRWCKSRLRILHIHPDGRSLSWKPAVGEPSSSKRPPKLDLSTCMEVRHAWSPDPLNPMFTGTPILRQKCEAANAHKSFALIFPKRTVDITAVTADQCKVLMEGLSALCFRLQVANLAGRGTKKGRDGVSRANDEEEVATTTASVTLTNSSTQVSPSATGHPRQQKRR